jgi:CheY-like chemotaxis protein
MCASNVEIDAPTASKHQGLHAGEYVCIAVSDTGCGMSKDVAARAFDPFFTTKPLGQGTGLGLSMVYGFVRQSGGTAVIESVPGQGTTVKLFLPRFSGSLPAASNVVDFPVAQPAASATASPSGKVILVVEDEKVVRGLVLQVLRDLGFEVIEAEDGPSGLEILKSDRHVDLLLTDIGLPGLNGRQLADGGRAIRPGLKVLLITGYDGTAMADASLEPGMHLMTKPFEMDALADRVRAMVSA